MKRKDWLNKPKKETGTPKPKKRKLGIVTDIVVKNQNKDRGI